MDPTQTEQGANSGKHAALNSPLELYTRQLVNPNLSKQEKFIHPCFLNLGVLGARAVIEQQITFALQQLERVSPIS